MSLNGAMLLALNRDQKPQNNVAQFVYETFDKLFGEPKNEIRMVKNMLVMSANGDPNGTAKKLLEFHLIFDEWFYANKGVQTIASSKEEH